MMSGIIRGPAPRRGFAPTYYYSTELYIDATYVTVLDRMQAADFFVPVATTFDRIGCTVTAAGTAGAVVRLGIYGASGGMPQALVLDAGTVDATTTGAKTITISQVLHPGWYYLAGVAQVATCTVRARGVGGSSWWVPQTAPGAENNVSWRVNSVSGALPNPFGASAAPGGSGANIKVELRAA